MYGPRLHRSFDSWRRTRVLLRGGGAGPCDRSGRAGGHVRLWSLYCLGGATRDALLVAAPACLNVLLLRIEVAAAVLIDEEGYTMGGLCSKEPEPEPIPPVVIDTKCVTGAQVSADGLRVTGDPSGVFVGIAMSKIFGNDKGYFEVRLAKVADASKVFVGLGKRDAEVDKLQKEKMAGDLVEGQTWVVSATELSVEEGAVVGVAYDGESFPAMLSFYTEASGDEPAKVVSGVRGDVRALVSVAAGSEVLLTFVEGGWSLKPPSGYGEVMAERRLM